MAQLDAAIERVEPAIPLPPPPHEFDAMAAQELEARQPASAAALPSCAFLTFVNTAQALNCASFSPDGSSLAGVSPVGFAVTLQGWWLLWHSVQPVQQLSIWLQTCQPQFVECIQRSEPVPPVLLCRWLCRLHGAAVRPEAPGSAQQQRCTVGRRQEPRRRWRLRHAVRSLRPRVRR